MRFLTTVIVAQALVTLLATAPNTQAISITASPNGDKIYHWEIDNLPPSVSQLKSQLHLAESLEPGKSQFDIVKDPISASSSSHVLRSLYPAHSYARSKDRHPSFISTPLPKEAFGGSQSRFIRLEYQMMFQPGFKWVKGGKLPGILAGSERGCNAACSGGGSAQNCFSTRMMWRSEGLGELYLYAAKSVYFPQEPVETCKRSLDKRSPEALFLLEKKRIDAVKIPEDEDEMEESSSLEKRGDESCLKDVHVKISPGAQNHCNPTYGISIGRGGSFQFKSGKWHNVTQIVRVNSKGNAVRDGYMSVHLDNNQVIQVKDLVLLQGGYDSSKDGASHQVKFMFSSFFGGHNPSYQTPSTQWIAWKGFKMTTSTSNIWE